jgi:hypothetical protein
VSCFQLNDNHLVATDPDGIDVCFEAEVVNLHGALGEEQVDALSAEGP